MADKKPDMSEMSASETAMRKFLKQLGVTTHPVSYTHLTLPTSG